MNTNELPSHQWSGHVVEIDYETSRFLVRYEGIPPDVGTELADRERQAGEAVARVNNDGFIVEIGDLPLSPGMKLYTLASLPAPQAAQAEPSDWSDTYAAFVAAFDTPLARRRQDDEYAQDARRRMREMNERIVAAAPSPDGKAEERHCMNCAEHGECRPNNPRGCGYEAEQAEAPSVPEELVCPECSEGFVLGSRAWSACSTCRGSGRTDVVGDYVPGTNRKVATQPTASNAGEREALTLAANRFDRLALDYPHESRGRHKVTEWAAEARAALASKPPAGEQKPVACKGIPRKGCGYLAFADTVCNKCGEIHHHHQMVAWFAAQSPEMKKP